MGYESSSVLTKKVSEYLIFILKQAKSLEFLIELSQNFFKHNPEIRHSIHYNKTNQKQGQFLALGSVFHQ